MPPDPVELLSVLISAASVNPMGASVDGPPFLESRMTGVLERIFESWGLPWQRQAVAPDRDNIVAILPGRSDQVVMFEAHQDTVGVEGMSIRPFEPVVRDGRMYGRGACDVKGGMAAMLAAIARLADEQPPDVPTIVMTCTVNEEHGFTGAAALAEMWQSDDRSLLPRRPDAAIVAEPTGLNVVVAHKGVCRWRCHTRGAAAHTSRPDLGDNAIYKMAQVVSAVEQYADEVVPALPQHPRCGGHTTCVSTIHGGVGVNTVPDRCSIEIDLRIAPDDSPLDARDDLIAFVAEKSRVAADHEPPYLVGRGLSDERNGPLADLVQQAVVATGESSDIIGVPYGTNAASFAATGVPTVVFGPGSIEQAHTADEWIDVDELRQASECYYSFARSRQ